MINKKNSTLVGPAIDQTRLEDYFNKTLETSRGFVDRTIKRFHLYNSRIISIGSGTGAEEVLLAKNNDVTCIEPDRASARFTEETAKRLGVKLKVSCTTVQDFKSDFKYDLIYSSSPSDWMYSPIKLVIPDYYIDFFNKYGNGLLILKLFGSNYKNWSFKSWYPRAFKKKLEKLTKFELKEYWLSEDGQYGTFVCVYKKDNWNPSERHGTTSHLTSLRYSSRHISWLWHRVIKRAYRKAMRLLLFKK